MEVIFVTSTCSPFEDRTLRRLQSMKKHPNIVWYSSLWTEIAPSDWIHRKNWSLLKDIFRYFEPSARAAQLYDSVQADEPPIVLMTLTETLGRETLADWLLRTKQARPEDVVVEFFEQVIILS